MHPHLNPLPQGGRGGGTHDILSRIGKRESLNLETIFALILQKTVTYVSEHVLPISLVYTLGKGRGQGEGSLF